MAMSKPRVIWDDGQASEQLATLMLAVLGDRLRDKPRTLDVAGWNRVAEDEFVISGMLQGGTLTEETK